MNRDLGAQRPFAMVHIDVDSLWVIAEHFSSSSDCIDCAIYTQAIPQFLAVLKKHHIPATFFCIGDDAKHNEQANIMRGIIAQGHEIANHTMNHRLDFSHLSPADLRKEIIESDAILRDITKTEIVGFRSPGYFIDDTILQTLQELDYLYDTSKFPTPVLRFMAITLYLLSGGIQTHKRFGRLRDSWGNQYPHYATTKQDYPNTTFRLLEIPISVIPIIRFPFHSSMIFIFGRWLFNLGIDLIRALGLPLVYMFHAVDLLPRTDDIAARMHPSLRVSFTQRCQIVDYMLKTIRHNFKVVTTRSFVEYFKKSL